MKKLLVALAVVASIGVSLNESNVVSGSNAQWQYFYHQGGAETQGNSDASLSAAAALWLGCGGCVNLFTL